MQTDKPLISILLAVYEPRLDWLREQLCSLEAQTYPNLRLYIRDDCSQSVTLEALEACVKSCIKRIPYTLTRNEKNLGSTKTFERLTCEAEGIYFAYCDQDDIWLPEKLDRLQQEAGQSKALLLCSDMYIIDSAGKQFADSIVRIRRHHTFRSGEGLSQELLFHNFVTGCTMLVQAEQAKAAIPFCPYMMHDHYLALWCAESGQIESIRQPLIRYRIHQQNQTALLSGVTDKKSYGTIRIEDMQKRFRWLQEHFPCGSALQTTLSEGLCWLDARFLNWQHQGGKREIWKYRKFSLLPSIFELFAPALPEPIFRLFVAFGRQNLI